MTRRGYVAIAGVLLALAACTQAEPEKVIAAKDGSASDTAETKLVLLEDATHGVTCYAINTGTLSCVKTGP